MMKIAATLIGAMIFNEAALCQSLPTEPDAQQESQQINVNIPVSSTASIELSIISKNGKCIGYLGRSPNEINFQVPAPCDIMTRGSQSGFNPHTRLSSTSPKEVTLEFQIVGNLKHYPQLRAECSYDWKNVRIEWMQSGINRSMKIGISPPPTNYNPEKDALHCPRFFYDLHPSHLP